MAKRTSRRKFLRKVAGGLPAVAAGGALAHIGLLTAKGKNGSKFRGDPAVWRSKVLQQAQAEKGGAAAVDVMDVPVRPTEVPMVMDIKPGTAPIISRAAEGVTKKSEILRM